jgi:hypothetical protein
MWELTPKRLARFREELERAGIGAGGRAKVDGDHAVELSVAVAVAEALVEFDVAATVRKAQYQRAREPHIFLSAEEVRLSAR